MEQTFPLQPTTEAGPASLIGMHRLQEVDVPKPDPALPEIEQVIPLWLAKLAKSYDLRMFIDKGGARWLLLRDSAGLISYARIEGQIRFLLTEAGAAQHRSDQAASALSHARRREFGAWLRRKLEERR